MGINDTRPESIGAEIGGAHAKAPLSSGEKPKPDAEVMRAHIARVHAHCEKLGLNRDRGVLVLTSIERQRDEDHKQAVSNDHFLVGDAERMASVAIAHAETRNVYMPLHLAKSSIGRGKRGEWNNEKCDIEAVFGVGVDEDASSTFARLPSFPPSIEVQTSGANKHSLYLLDGPLTPQEAVNLLDLAAQHLGGDKGASGRARIWRIPGSLNHPDYPKVKAGRSPIAQPVRLLRQGEAYTPWNLQASIRRLPIIRVKAETIATDWSGEGSQDAAEIMARVKDQAPFVPDLMAMTDKPGSSKPDRSGHSMDVMLNLMECGLTDGEVFTVSNGAPFSAKFWERGDLPAEITRARAVWAGKGSKLKATLRAEGQAIVDGLLKGNAAKAGATQPATEGKAPATPVEWPDPIPLNVTASSSAPVFPLHCLPDVMRAWAIDVNRRSQVPVEMLAVPALATMAACIGNGVRLQMKANDTGWKERAILWGMVIAPKGTNKSYAFAEATKPLDAIDERYAEEYREALEAHAPKKTAAEQELKAWEASYKKAAQAAYDGGGIGAGLSDEYHGLGAPPKVPDDPARKRIVVKDHTREALSVAMAGNGDAGLILASDELRGFFGNMSRYSKGDDRPFYLECHNGASESVLRKGSSHFIDSKYLCVAGGIQPAVARETLSGKGAVDDGLLERFGLMAFPTFSDDWRHVDEAPDAQAMQDYRKTGEALAAMDWRKAGGGVLWGLLCGVERPCVHMSDGARVLWNEFHERNNKALRRLSPEDPIRGFLGKADALSGQLMLTLHLVAYASGEVEQVRYIEEATARAAIELIETFFAPTWKRVLGEFSSRPVDRGADRIGRYLCESKVKTISRRDVTRKNWSGLTDSEEIDCALNELVEHAWLAEPTGIKTGKRGRPPSDALTVNPKIYSQKLKP